MVWLVLGPHYGGLPHLMKPVWRPGSQKKLGCPKSGHGYPGRHHRCPRSGYGWPGSSHGCFCGVEVVLELHQEYSGVVKLVVELHHVSQGGKQGEFRDGGASVWASLCEFQW